MLGGNRWKTVTVCTELPTRSCCCCCCCCCGARRKPIRWFRPRSALPHARGSRRGCRRRRQPVVVVAPCGSVAARMPERRSRPEPSAVFSPLFIADHPRRNLTNPSPPKCQKPIRSFPLPYVRERCVHTGMDHISSKPPSSLTTLSTPSVTASDRNRFRGSFDDDDDFQRSSSLTSTSKEK